MATTRDPAGARKPSSRLERLKRVWIGAALIVFNTIVLLSIIEIGARSGLAIPDGLREPDPVEDVDPTTLARAYPGRTLEQIRGARDAAVLTQVYAPWVQFRGPDRETPEVGVSGFERRSIPAVSRSAEDGEYFDVFFFGGSTMQGTRVSDDETIPAHFARIVGERGGSARPVRVHNYGQPYFYSLQESTLLFTLLMQGARPQAAVFLDGLNDILQPGSTYYRQPFWTPKLEALFDDDLPSMSTTELIFALWRTTGTRRLIGGAGVAPASGRLRSSYSPPPDLDEEQLVTSILSNYLDTIDSTQALCRAFDIDCYFFWQPIPHYHYPNRHRDPFAKQEPSSRFEAAYARMDARAGRNRRPCSSGTCWSGKPVTRSSTRSTTRQRSRLESRNVCSTPPACPERLECPLYCIENRRLTRIT